MDPVHVHLLLNHFPIIGSIFAFCLILTGWLMKKRILERAGMVSLVLLAIIAIPVYSSGEKAEHKVEKLPTASEHYIEKHEDIAGKAYWSMLVAGMIGLASLTFSRFIDKKQQFMHLLALVVTGITIYFMFMAGWYGGKIIRPEIRNAVIEIQNPVQPAMYSMKY